MLLRYCLRHYHVQSELGSGSHESGQNLYMSLDKSYTLASLKVSTTPPIHSPTGPSNEASIHSSHKCKMTSNEKPVLGEPSEDCTSVFEAEPIGLQAYKV